MKHAGHNPSGTIAVLCSVLGLCCVLPFTSRAIVDINSTANTSAPSDGSPWVNMGHVNGSSGIYLGAGWVLTAAHVGAGNVDFSGSFFPFDGLSRQLTNSDGSLTDIVAFHLASLPNLPRMPLSASTPPAFTPLDLIGFGFNAASAVTTIGPYTGVFWSATQVKSWGSNKIDRGGVTNIFDGMFNITVFSMDLTAPGTAGPGAPTADEAMAAPGDSGGGVFEKVGSTWQLVGLIDAISTFPDQLGSTSVFGNGTYAGDIATYAPQIQAILGATQPALSISRSDTNVMVCWPDTGVAYKLEASATLAPPSWTNLTPALISTNGQLCALLPASGTARFFRLQKQ